MEVTKYCLCGCGEEIFTKTARFKSGHSKNLKNKKPPLCACGCGEETHFDCRLNKWNNYIVGHQSRVRTEETRKKISIGNKGKKISKETREKISKGCMGKPPTIGMTGKKHSEETKELLRSINTGFKVSDETKKNISISLKGRRHSDLAKENMSIASAKRWGIERTNWNKKDRKLVEEIRNLTRYREWRSSVYSRDNYICRDCGKIRGGDLNAHHIIPFMQLLFDYCIEDIEDAIKCECLWDIDNGVTLCSECHKQKHKTRSVYAN